MTIVVCVAANGFYLPSLFILPGQRLNRATMEQFSINVITATVDTKGFMNSNMFIKWLDHFSSNVPSHVNWTVVLV